MGNTISEQSMMIMPFAAASLVFLAMLGSVVAADLAHLIIRDRFQKRFQHPVTLWRFGNMCIGLMLALGLWPDAIFVMTYGDVPMEVSAKIRFFDFIAQMLMPVPAVAWAMSIIAIRKNTSDQFLRGHMEGATQMDAHIAMSYPRLAAILGLGALAGAAVWLS